MEAYQTISEHDYLWKRHLELFAKVLPISDWKRKVDITTSASYNAGFQKFIESLIELPQNEA